LAQDWRKIPKVQGLTSQVVPKTVAKYINHRWHQKDIKNYRLLLMTYEFVQLKNMHRNCNPPS
jgi:hypothetical protein